MTTTMRTETPPSSLQLLAGYALAGERERFLQTLQQVDTTVWDASSMLQALDHALHLDLIDAALTLAQAGAARFPDEPRLVQANLVLHPSRGRVVPTTRPGALAASQAWLRDHASPYRGQWVVVRDGQLLGAAPELASLRDMIAREQDPATTIITRVW